LSIESPEMTGTTMSLWVMSPAPLSPEALGHAVGRDDNGP